MVCQNPASRLARACVPFAVFFLGDVAFKSAQFLFLVTFKSAGHGLPKSGLSLCKGVGSFCSFIFGDLAFKSAGYRNLIGLDRDRDARRYDSPIYLTHKLSPDIHLLELEFCLLSLLHFRHSLLHPERQ